MEYLLLSSFVIYFCGLVAVGLYFYTKAQHASEYMIGNRSVNYWVTAVATQASDMGPWLFMGYPAMVYAHGLFEAWTAIGLVVFMFLNWQFIAPRLRTVTEETNSYTLSSFFARSCNDTSGSIQLVSALMSLLFFTFYIASGLVALGRLFEVAFGLNYHTGLFASLISAAVYTLIGGFVAVAWCDFMQGMFLLFMILLVPIIAFFVSGGWTSITTAAHLGNISLSLIPADKSLAHAVLLAAGWGLGYFGQPHILINFMGIDDVKNMRRAQYVGITWQILVLTSAIAIGIVGLGYFGPHALSGELVYITMAKQLFPPFFAGFVLCAILAAALSTMDSLIFLSGSVLAEDVYKNIFHRAASAHLIVWVSRLCTIAVSCIALYIAWDNNNNVYELVHYAWSGLGSSFGPLVIALLYGQSYINRYGALSGIISGGLTAAFWPYLNPMIIPTLVLPSLIPGYVISFACLYGISWITSKQ